LQELQAAAQAINTAADQAAWREAVKRFQQVALSIVTDYIGDALPDAIPGVPELREELERLLQDFEHRRDDLRRQLTFGPLRMDVDLPLAMATFAQPAGPPVTLPLGLLPPTGFGAKVDAGGATGGGRVSIQRSPDLRLTGSFGLKLRAADVSSFVTLQQDAGVASSVLLLVARFTPGIQLGFGFALGGIGGLIGVNRQINLDAIRARFVSGEAVNALFPDDVVTDAPRVLATLDAIFPRRAGTHLFGPALQITWLKIGASPFFRVDIGVFAELPNFAHVAIAGVARAEIPVTLHLRMDVLGEIDGPKETLTISAALVDSYVMGVFRVGGTAAFQMCFGERPYTVLTIGGFYPGFNPEPAVLPPQQRVGLATDSPLPGLYLRVEGYFAVTPNTVQFGGRLEAGFGTDDFGAHGFLMLDAFVQFSPFHFESHFAAGFGIEAFGEELAGVSITGSISGPGPIAINANLTFEVLFFDVSWSDTFMIGEPRPPDVLPQNLLETLLDEVTGANLRSQDADDRWVERSRNAGDNGLTLLAPHGRLVWSQRRSPLNVVVERLDGAPLPKPQGVRVAVTSRVDVTRDRFSPGQFRNLGDAEKLNQPPFDWLESGAVVGFSDGLAQAVEHTLEFDEFYRRDPEHLMPSIFFLGFHLALLNALGGQLADATVGNTEPKINIKDEVWMVRPGERRRRFASQTEAHVVAGREAGVALPALDVVSLEATI
jgi:hypothetical protein